jgi:1-acyl-sn-glycerol-3-phosphate acyltransferase
MKNYSKLPLLGRFEKDLDISVKGRDNIDPSRPKLFVANHTSLMDIFAVPAGINEDTYVVVSNRVLYQNKTVEKYLRRHTIENAINALPLEVHNGSDDIEKGLKTASDMLARGDNVTIFPEGAYTPERDVTRGRTGAARILLGAATIDKTVDLVPICIDNEPWPDENTLDDYIPDGRKITLTIGEAIDYSEELERYHSGLDFDDQRMLFHEIIDKTMLRIAEWGGYRIKMSRLSYTRAPRLFYRPAKK